MYKNPKQLPDWQPNVLTTRHETPENYIVGNTKILMLVTIFLSKFLNFNILVFYESLYFALNYALKVISCSFYTQAKISYEVSLKRVATTTTTWLCTLFSEIQFVLNPLLKTTCVSVIIMSWKLNQIKIKKICKNRNSCYLCSLFFNFFGCSLILGFWSRQHKMNCI